MKQLLFLLTLIFTLPILAQEEAPQNWWDLDREENSYPGVSAARAHQYLQGKKGQKVVVAVIDSGVDVAHEDLKDIVWTNGDEIPGNGIDDDNNGYIDDIHGWNFIGGADGRNVSAENLEVVRLYNAYKQKYNNRNREGLSKEERAEYDLFKQYEREIEDKRASIQPKFEQHQQLKTVMDYGIEKIGKPADEITAEDVEALQYKDMETDMLKRIVGGVTARGGTFAGVYQQIKRGYDYYNDQLNYNYNPDFDGRDIVGDNPGDLDDRNYGNGDVIGPDAGHGTHVAGIIAAVRDNDLGVNGVGGPNVEIMSIRTVPNGDERDKDVANAIRYAVDNGAQVINMSFGKGQSPYKGAVDDAIRYAEKNDVVLVHAAGNDGKELTLTNNFPNDVYERRGFLKPKSGRTWIEVGAATPTFDDKLAAGFSNYNKEYVDVFAPGQSIYSTVPGDGYDTYQGTSMAAPMVTGIAALIRSYFPDLSARQVREIILESAIPVNLEVVRPGSEEGEATRVNFSDLSATGGLANAYTAIRFAEREKGKKKKAPQRDATLMKF